MNLLMVLIEEERMARRKKLHWLFAPIILLVMGIVVALTVMPTKTHADTMGQHTNYTTYSGSVACGAGSYADLFPGKTYTGISGTMDNTTDWWWYTDTLGTVAYTGFRIAVQCSTDNATWGNCTDFPDTGMSNTYLDLNPTLASPSGETQISATSHVLHANPAEYYKFVGYVCDGFGGGGTSRSVNVYTDSAGNPYARSVGLTFGGYVPPAVNLTTRIVSVDPADNTATTTQPIPTMTYWAASTTQLNVLNATIYRMDTGGNQLYATSTFVTPPSDDYATWTTFGGQIWLSDNATYKVVYTGYDQHNFANNLIFATTTTFYTGTNGWFEVIGATSTNSQNLHALATSTCSVVNISGCFQNALVWAFVPSEDSLTALKNTGTSLGTVKPFGYFVELRAALTPSTTTPALVNLSQYVGSGTAWGILFFDPLKTILSIIFWVANLMMLYMYWRKKEV